MEIIILLLKKVWRLVDAITRYLWRYLVIMKYWLKKINTTIKDELC